MPSLINNPGNITDVGANYRRAFSPFTAFGTRKLKIMAIEVGGDLSFESEDVRGFSEMESYNDNNYGYRDGQPNFSSDSYVAKVITGVQAVAEVYGVFYPYSDPDGGGYYYNYMCVLVADDNYADRVQMNDYDLPQPFGDNSQTMADAVYDALGGDNNGDLDYVDVYSMVIDGTDFYSWYGSDSLAANRADRIANKGKNRSAMRSKPNMIKGPKT